LIRVFSDCLCKKSSFKDFKINEEVDNLLEDKKENNENQQNKKEEKEENKKEENGKEENKENKDKSEHHLSVFRILLLTFIVTYIYVTLLFFNSAGVFKVTIYKKNLLPHIKVEVLKENDICYQMYKYQGVYDFSKTYIDEKVAEGYNKLKEYGHYLNNLLYQKIWRGNKK
jgi:hypothetical protein